MRTIGAYALQVITPRSFDDAVARARELLAEQGFGVLTEIDVQATLARKLGVAYKRYLILGACNPPFAHRALEVDPHLGVLLPCNVAIWDEGDHRVVAAMEPRVMADIAGERVRTIADEVSARIHRVLENIDKA